MSEYRPYGIRLYADAERKMEVIQRKKDRSKSWIFRDALKHAQANFDDFVRYLSEAPSPRGELKVTSVSLSEKDIKRFEQLKKKFMKAIAPAKVDLSTFVYLLVSFYAKDKQ